MAALAPGWGKNYQKKPRTKNLRFEYSLKEVSTLFLPFGLSVRTKFREQLEKDWTYFTQHYQDALTSRPPATSNSERSH
jgi:hypothetical protein